MLKDIALVFTSPLNQAILLVAIGLCVVIFLPNNKKLYKTCFIVASVWFYLCSQYFFSFMLIAPLEDYATPIKIEDMQEHKRSSIFVLACYYFDAPDKPLVSQWNDCSLRRLVQAALMYKNKPQPIIVTGGQFNPNSEAVYAEAAKGFLITLGVAASDIIALSADNGTKYEITALKQYKHLNEHHFVVSSATHSYRVSQLLKQANVYNYTLFPVDHYNVNPIHYQLAMPNIAHLRRSEAALYEYAAIVKMWFENL